MKEFILVFHLEQEGDGSFSYASARGKSLEDAIKRHRGGTTNEDDLEILMTFEVQDSTKPVLDMIKFLAEYAYVPKSEKRRKKA